MDYINFLLVPDLLTFTCYILRGEVAASESASVGLHPRSNTSGLQICGQSVFAEDILPNVSGKW